MWRVGYSESADDSISVPISSTSVLLSSLKFSTVIFAFRSTTVAPTVVVSTSFAVMLADGFESNVVSFELLELNWLLHWLIFFEKILIVDCTLKKSLQTMCHLCDANVVPNELVVATIGVGRLSFTVVVTSDCSGSTFLSKKII